MIFLWPRITIFEFFADFLESNESFNYPCFFSFKGEIRSNIPSHSFCQIFFREFSFEYSFADFLESNESLSFFTQRRFSLKYSSWTFCWNFFCGFKKKKSSQQFFLERKSAKESMKRKSCTINHICPHFYISLQPSQKETAFKWIFFVFAWFNKPRYKTSH